MIFYCSRQENQSTAFAPLAQKVEHLTFNQGVRSSTLRWSTKDKLGISLNMIYRVCLLKHYLHLQAYTPFFFFNNTHKVDKPCKKR